MQPKATAATGLYFSWLGLGLRFLRIQIVEISAIDKAGESVGLDDAVRSGADRA